MRLYRVKRCLLDFFYPNRCPFCGEVIRWYEYFCDGCEDNLTFIDTEEPLSGVDRAISVCEYDDAAKKLIFGFKENSDGCAASAAAWLIADKLRRKGITADVITAAPMLPKDKRRRGYNQSELIAREVGQLLSIEFKPLLLKTRKTAAQKTLNEEQRRRNLSGAFAVRKNADLKGKNVILIDDVRTTGSTLCEGARTLKKAGAQTVVTATLAKTVKKAVKVKKTDMDS